MGILIKAVIAVSLFIGSMVVFSAIRKKFYAGNEITNADLVASAFIVLTVGMISGEISTFKAGDIEVTKAIHTAKDQSISGDITQIGSLPFSPVAAAVKGGVSDIPKMVQQNKHALKLTFGYEYYSDEVIDDYLEHMLEWNASGLGPYYILFCKPDGSFFGVIPLFKLSYILFDSEMNGPSISLSKILRNNQYDKIASLDGVLLETDAVTTKEARFNVLEHMDKSGHKMLPVLDGNKFVGFADREQLTVNLVVSITQSLNNK